MPIYLIRCDKCQKEDEVFRTVREYDDLPNCCGQKTHRIMGKTYANPDIQPYISQVDGSVINSRTQHRNHLKQHNCIEIGNETKYLKAKPLAPPPGLKETLVRVVNEKL